MDIEMTKLERLIMRLIDLIEEHKEDPLHEDIKNFIKENRDVKDFPELATVFINVVKELSDERNN